MIGGGQTPKEWRTLSAKFAKGSLEQGEVKAEMERLFGRAWFPGESGDHAAIMVQLTFALMWGRCGFPHIVLKPMRTAYFATTQIKPDCANMFEPPWPAFFISLADSELHTTDLSGKECQITGLTVWSCVAEPDDEAVLRNLCKVGDRCWSFVAVTSEGVCIYRSKYTYNWDSSGDKANSSGWAGLAELPTIFGETQSESDLRLNLLLAQLIAGVCLEFQTVDGVRESSSRRAKGKAARQTLHRYVSATPMPFVLGDDVLVDVRRVVSEYHKGGGASPTVRSFVRPHPRRQRFGQGNLQAKVVRIEGFWRGPKGAPIRARTHKWRGE